MADRAGRAGSDGCGGAGRDCGGGARGCGCARGSDSGARQPAACGSWNNYRGNGKRGQWSRGAIGRCAEPVLRAAGTSFVWPPPRLPASCSCAARACPCTPEPPPPPPPRGPWSPASRAAVLPCLQPRPGLHARASASRRAPCSALLASRALARPLSPSRARADAAARRRSICASTDRPAGAAAGSGRGEEWRSGGRPDLAGEGAPPPGWRGARVWGEKRTRTDGLILRGDFFYRCMWKLRRRFFLPTWIT